MIALIPVMTSNTADGYVISASNEQYSPAYCAFNGVSTCWEPSGGKGQLVIQIPSPYVVTQYSMTHNNNADWGNRYALNFTLDGWNGSSWITLDTQINAPSFDKTSDIHTFSFANTTAYSKYRLNVTAHAGGAQLMVFGLQLYGSPPATNKNQATSGGT